MTTKIEWTDRTWNPVTGCSYVSEECQNCYAEGNFNRFSKMPERGGVYLGRKFGDVQCHPERLAWPARWRKPSRIFVNSMSDIFHEKVPDDFLIQLFNTMVKQDHHTYQILTKRPYRARHFFETCFPDTTQFPPHIWMGVSAGTQKAADERVPPLLRLPFQTLFASAEPLLGPVDFSHWMQPQMQAVRGNERFGLWSGVVKPERFIEPTLGWVIAGGESGPNARPAHPDWFRKLRDDCERYNVPFFFKQWGAWGPLYPQYGDTDPVIKFEDIEEVNKQCAPVEVCLENNGHMPVGDGDDGEPFCVHQPMIGLNPWWMGRVGKKASGNVLDGTTYEQFPEVAG